jgi:5'(3')-deoxyribonucleotidase
VRRPRILIDVDGPLTRGFFEVACRLLREYGVAGATPEKINQWDIFKALGAGKMTEDAVRDRLQRPGVAAGFLPNAGARPFLDELRTWADVYAVTAPLDGSDTWTRDREIWLEKELGFDINHIVHARDKRVVAGDIFIDDKPEHLEAWSKEYPGKSAILWREPHNASSTWIPWIDSYAALKVWIGAFINEDVRTVSDR